LSEISIPRLHEERRAARRGSAAGSWAITLLGLALVALTAWWVTHSRIFEARTIEVRGNVHLSQPEVLRLAGLSARTNVLWFSPGRVADRLESEPWSLSALVSRSFPSTVSVTIRERSPVAVLVSDRRYLVAGDGTVMGVVGGETELPTIPGPPTARVGSRIAATGPELVIVKDLPPRVRDQAARVANDRRSGLVLVLRGGARVVYGDASDARAKGTALSAVLRWAGEAGVTPGTIDVRAPSQPALRPAA
jgi:cell division protein FtsQ